MYPKPKPNNPFFNQSELADRWRVSDKTLERWRYEGKEPTYVKIHGRVLYRFDDILTFEDACSRKNKLICDLEDDQ